MAKGKKLDFKKIAMNTLIVGGTGAVAQVIAKAIEGDVVDGAASNSDVVTYGMIAAGIILPEVIKSDTVETMAGAALAIGAYRMAAQYDLGSMLGINGMNPQFNSVGNSPWKPVMRPTENAKSKKVTY